MMSNEKSLLDQIIEMGIFGNDNITRLLAAVVLLGQRIGDPKVSDWAEREIQGYPEHVGVPDYRFAYPVPVTSRWFAVFNDESYEVDIHTDDLESFAQIDFGYAVRQSVSELQGLMNGSIPITEYWSSQTVSEYPTVMRTRPRDMNPNLSVNLVNVKKMVSPQFFATVLESVRVKVVRLAAELQAVGDAEIGQKSGPTISDSSVGHEMQEKVERVLRIDNHFSGGIINVAQGRDYQQDNDGQHVGSVE